MTAPRLSFEFFPPKSELQALRFWRAFGALETVPPTHVSVTWGALGADSGASLALLEALRRETRLPIVAHLTCAGQSAAQLHATLDTLTALGIDRVLALRGDAGGGDKAPGSFAHATELVALLRERGGFEVSVAAYPEVHPEAISAEDDLRWLCRKAELGATRAVTQFFFEPEPFLRLRDALAKRNAAMTLIPGVLPVHDIDKVVSFAATCGSRVPESLRRRFAACPDAAQRQALALDEASSLCNALRAEGVEDFHIYTLNRAPLAVALAERLGASARADKRATIRTSCTAANPCPPLPARA